MKLSQIHALTVQLFAAQSRSIETHAFRGLSALLVATLILPISDLIGGPRTGLTIFTGITECILIFSTYLGCYWFPRVIAEERAQGTYGLLLLTGLGPGTLLLSKSMARVQMILLCAAATVPFWFLCITFGGLTSSQVLAASILLAAHLIVVSQIGTLCAVCFDGGLRPCLAALGLVSLYTFFPRVIPSFDPLLGHAGLTRILWPGFANLQSVTMWSLGATLVACLLFAASWWILGRTASVEPAERRFPPWREWISFGPGSRLRPRPCRVWRRALVWKEFHDAVWGWQWLVGMTILGGPMLAILIALSSGSSFGTSSLTAASIFAIAAVCDAAAEMFGREIRHRTWDTLRLVPISFAKITWSKFLGRVPSFLPVIVILVPGILLTRGDVEWLLGELSTRPGTYAIYGCIASASAALAVLVLCLRSILRNPFDGAISASAVLLFLAIPNIMALNGMMDWSFILVGAAAIAGLAIATALRIRTILEGESVN